MQLSCWTCPPLGWATSLWLAKPRQMLHPRSPPTLSSHWREPNSKGFWSPFWHPRDVKILNSIHFKSISIVHIIIARVYTHFPWLTHHDSPTSQEEGEEGHTLLPLARPLLQWHMLLGEMGGCRNGKNTSATLQSSIPPMLSNCLKPRLPCDLLLHTVDTTRGSKPIKLVLLPLGLDGEWNPFALSLVTMSQAKCKGHLINPPNMLITLSSKPKLTFSKEHQTGMCRFDALSRAKVTLSLGST